MGASASTIYGATHRSNVILRRLLQRAGDGILGLLNTGATHISQGSYSGMGYVSITLSATHEIRAYLQGPVGRMAVWVLVS